MQIKLCDKNAKIEVNYKTAYLKGKGADLMILYTRLTNQMLNAGGVDKERLKKLFEMGTDKKYSEEYELEKVVPFVKDCILEDIFKNTFIKPETKKGKNKNE